jgi:hypothetical protein
VRLDFIVTALALCLASGTASAQESTTMPNRGGVEGSELIRPCAALASQSDCALGLGLPMRPSGTLDGRHMLRDRGLNSGLTNERNRLSPAAGVLGPEDRLSRGISGGRVGMGSAVGPLGSRGGSLFGGSSGLGGR